MSQQFVAFIDLLGFKNFVMENDQTIVLDILENIFKAIDSFCENHHDITKVVFSDSIVISMLYNEATFKNDNLKFLWLINTIQCASTTIKDFSPLPMRGGITRGEYYVDETKNIFFGKAFLRAYQLESKNAMYPAIILDESKFSYKADLPAKELRYNPIVKDIDGNLYCNYLSTNYRLDTNTWSDLTISSLSNHKLFILNNLLENFDTDDINSQVVLKYQWMAEYHNWFCEPFPEFQEYKLDLPSSLNTNCFFS